MCPAYAVLFIGSQGVEGVDRYGDGPVATVAKTRDPVPAPSEPGSPLVPSSPPPARRLRSRKATSQKVEETLEVGSANAELSEKAAGKRKAAGASGVSRSVPEIAQEKKTLSEIPPETLEDIFVEHVRRLSTTRSRMWSSRRGSRTSLS